MLYQIPCLSPINMPVTTSSALPQKICEMIHCCSCTPFISIFARIELTPSHSTSHFPSPSPYLHHFLLHSSSFPFNVLPSCCSAFFCFLLDLAFFPILAL